MTKEVSLFFIKIRPILNYLTDNLHQKYKERNIVA